MELGKYSCRQLHLLQNPSDLGYSSEHLSGNRRTSCSSSKSDGEVSQVDGESGSGFPMHSSEPMTYTDWCLGQPNNADGNQRCATANDAALLDKRCWDDQDCGELYPFICERKSAL
ncbi:hypothetical protein WMY93_005871 [Mugilogobius chulae]|uniref:C-type lectin domain-containing protein n=1 Tax=Mugilogobius chulae TaxID=88201 RepID=A0AAW0PMG5_9GOBI